MVDQSGPVSTCGPYTIIRTLGEGGNAVVKLCEKDGQKYAIKIFMLDQIAKTDTVIAKTKHEFDIVQNLNNKYIMKYIEFNENATWQKKNGEQKQVCYLVMELLDGVELLELLNECQE